MQNILQGTNVYFSFSENNIIHYPYSNYNTLYEFAYYYSKNVIYLYIAMYNNRKSKYEMFDYTHTRNHDDFNPPNYCGGGRVRLTNLSTENFFSRGVRKMDTTIITCKHL